MPTPRRRIYFKLRASSKIDFCLKISFYAYILVYVMEKLFEKTVKVQQKPNVVYNSLKTVHCLTLLVSYFIYRYIT